MSNRLFSGKDPGPIDELFVNVITKSTDTIDEAVSSIKAKLFGKIQKRFTMHSLLYQSDIDMEELIVQLNFELILEYDNQGVSIKDEQFANWLNLAVVWIKNGRPNLIKRRTEVMDSVMPLPEFLTTRSYDEIHNESNRIAQLIYETDTKILQEFIQHRSKLNVS